MLLILSHIFTGVETCLILWTQRWFQENCRMLLSTSKAIWICS